MALNAIIIISWTRKGQLSMEEWSQGVSDKQQHTVTMRGRNDPLDEVIPEAKANSMNVPQ